MIDLRIFITLSFVAPSLLSTGAGRLWKAAAFVAIDVLKHFEMRLFNVLKHVSPALTLARNGRTLVSHLCHCSTVV